LKRRLLRAGTAFAVSLLLTASCIQNSWREGIRCGPIGCPAPFACCRGLCLSSCSDASDVGHNDAGADAASDGQDAGPALVISVDFVGPGQPMGLTEVAGVTRAAYWNSAAGEKGSISNLISWTGAGTGAALSWITPPEGLGPLGTGLLGYADAPGDVRMMNGYIRFTMSPSLATVTVTALPDSVAARGYDLYIYAAGSVPPNDSWTYRYALSSSAGPATIVQNGPTPTTFTGFTPVGSTDGTPNYVVFSHLTNASFTLTATALHADVSPQEGPPINGFQIVSPAAP
jgi:hypothetical protein